jgi:hypothetical protein
VSTTRTENDFLSSRATTPIADVSGNQHQDRYRGLLVYDLRRSMAQNMRNFGIGRGGSYRVVPKLVALAPSVVVFHGKAGHGWAVLVH